MKRHHNITLEDARRRQEALREALAKYHAGRPLTSSQWILVAYSTEGTAAGCHCNKS